MPTRIDPHSAPVTPAERCALEPKWGATAHQFPDMEWVKSCQPTAATGLLTPTRSSPG